MGAPLADDEAVVFEHAVEPDPGSFGRDSPLARTG